MIGALIVSKLPIRRKMTVKGWLQFFGACVSTNARRLVQGSVEWSVGMSRLSLSPLVQFRCTKWLKNSVLLRFGSVRCTKLGSEFCSSCHIGFQESTSIKS